MALAASFTLVLAGILLWSPVLLISAHQALVLLLVAAALAGWRGGPRPLAITLLAGLPLVLVAASLDSLLREPWPAGSATPLGSAPDLLGSGSVCEFPRAQPGSRRFILIADDESRSRGVPERVLVSWYESSTWPGAMPEPGQRWRLNLRLRPPRALSNPGGFDYERWLFSQHIGATGWVRESAANGRLPGSTPDCPAAGWRAEIARQIAAALKGRDAAPYVLGLAIGAYQALPESEWDKLRRTGTIHLISISGFHIALVAGPAALLGLVLARFLLAAGCRCRPRVLAAWTALLAASLYGALAGFSVPTARSVLAVGLLAVLATCRRRISGAEFLFTVVLGVLLIEPLAPLVPGFWLSFAGVTVLVAAGMALRTGTGAPGSVRLLLVTQAGMTVGLAPLLVLFFGQIPLSGTLANLVAVPAFTLVLLPVTLIGTATVVVAPRAGAAILGMAADCFDVWRWFLDWCASLPMAVWYLPEPPLVAILLAGVGVVSALWPPPWPLRWLSLGMLAGLMAASSGPVPPGGLRVTVLDVGQGLAVLLQTAGHTLLYDTGPAFRNSDAGERVVVPALQALGVRTLDTLLVSHADADHRGGAASVLERYPAHRLLGAGPDHQQWTPCRAGSSWWWDGFTFEILHPAADSRWSDDNARSCVLRVSGAGVSLLFPGDIEAGVERDLVAQAGLSGADLVVAPHHGSRTSSSAEFVAATRPRYVVFATGFQNRWHFPATEVVERWREAGACVLDTGADGALQFEVTPGTSLRLVSRQRAVAPGVWVARPGAAPPCK
ncbi:MAG: DNA internalization-related competence protein ComEC/Rec2 [Gammaproteobacteria bacterium]|nr:DNA internalization-related competence protein ComEC/Rec2 [Gammaproteobacteria bacterium]